EVAQMALGLLRIAVLYVRSLGGLSHSHTDAESAPCAAVTRRALPVAIYAGHTELIFGTCLRFTYAPGGNPQTVPSAQGAPPLPLAQCHMSRMRRLPVPSRSPLIERGNRLPPHPQLPPAKTFKTSLTHGLFRGATAGRRSDRRWRLDLPRRSAARGCCLAWSG